MKGTTFGRYQLIQLIGRGGMGEVWRAFDTATDRIVAIKVLPAHLSADEEFQHRFRREARAAAGLNDPHVVPIHDFGEIDGRLYVNMRLIDGHDLNTLLTAGRLAPHRAVWIVEQVAGALNAAHKIGLIHRDVKPSNVLVTEDDFAYLIDFGIARTSDQTGLTQTGAQVGTWAYMAPERFSSASLDPRSDVYALACVLHECLTGQRPFPGDSLEQQIAGHMMAPPPRPSYCVPGLPAPMDQVVATGLAKDPAHRYPTAKELATGARTALTTPPMAPPQSAAAYVTAAPPIPQPPPARPRRKRGALIAAAAFGAVIAVTAAVVIAFALPDGKESPSTSTSASNTETRSAAAEYGTQIVLPFTDIYRLLGLAVDAAGNVFIVNKKDRIAKVAGSTTQTILPFADLDGAMDLAVDTIGNLYVTAYNWRDPPRVLKLAADSTTPAVLPFTDLKPPFGGVTADASGNVYVSDMGNGRVLKLAPGADAPVVVPVRDVRSPAGLTVDSKNNAYVVDPSNKRVVRLAQDSGTQTVVGFTGLTDPGGVAVDTAGNIYLTDAGRVLKLAAGSNEQTVLPFFGLTAPQGVAVDAGGNVYVACYTETNSVVKLPAA